jgi:DNA-binding response OmpR family regulator
MDGARCLLLLEPHEDTSRLVARLLRERGFDVAVASNGDAALAVAACRSLDLAMIDTALPDMELPDLLRGLRSLSADVPLIATTTAIAERLTGLRAMPFHRVLLKPYGLEELLDALAAAVPDRHACGCTWAAEC